MKKLKKPTLLIDGDILAYRASAACDGRQYTVSYTYKETTVVSPFVKYKKDADFLAKKLVDDGCEDVKVDIQYVPESLETAQQALEDSITTLKKLVSVHCDGIGNMKFFTTRNGSFRDKEFKGYKENRTDVRRPHHLEALKDYLQDKYGATTSNHGCFEADDMLAMLQTDRTIICSIDKDLLQIPGYHFNWVKNKFIEISEEEGLRNLYTQMLTGDATDGIPGIYGVGPVTAQKALSKVTSEWMMYCTVLKMYIEKTPLEDGEDRNSEEFWMKCVQLVHCHATLLYLLRHTNDRWVPPKQEGVSDFQED